MPVRKVWTAPVLGVLKASDTKLSYGGPFQDFTSATDSIYCYSNPGAGIPPPAYCTES